MHLQMRLYRLCLHSIEELREILAEAMVVLGPHQQIDRAETVLLGEEIKHIRFVIHDRDRTYAVELVSEPGHPLDLDITALLSNHEVHSTSGTTRLP